MWHSNNFLLPCITVEEKFIISTAFKINRLFSTLCSWVVCLQLSVIFPLNFHILLSIRLNLTNFYQVNFLHSDAFCILVKMWKIKQLFEKIDSKFKNLCLRGYRSPQPPFQYLTYINKIFKTVIHYSIQEGPTSGRDILRSILLDRRCRIQFPVTLVDLVVRTFLWFFFQNSCKYWLGSLRKTLPHGGHLTYSSRPLV